MTPWSAGEPGSMIQTSIEPDGLDEDCLELVAALSSLPPPPHALTATATASNAPTAMNLLFIDPPREPSPLDGCLGRRVGGMIWRRRPATATPVATAPAASG